MTDRPTPTGAPTAPRTLAELDKLAEPLHARVITREAMETMTRLAYEKGLAEARASASLDEQKVRALFREMWHESTHPGDGVAESCITCIRKADDLIEYARLSEQPGGEK